MYQNRDKRKGSEQMLVFQDGRLKFLSVKTTIWKKRRPRVRIHEPIRVVPGMSKRAYPGGKCGKGRLPGEKPPYLLSQH